MQYTIAASRILLNVGTSLLWGDSAYAPAQPVIAVRLPRGMSDAPNFGGVGTYIGQSYDPGAHPPR